MNVLGLVGSFTASFTWAAGSHYYNELSRRYTPAAVNFNRAVIAFPCFLILNFVLAGSMHGGLLALGAAPLSAILWFSLAMIGSFAFGDICFLAAAKRLGMPSAQALASIYPFWSALSAWIWRGERLGGTGIVGLTLLVLGCVTVILGGKRKRKGEDLAHGKDYVVGVGLAFFCSLLWALNTYASSEGARSVPTVVASVYRMGWALLLCPLVGRMLGDRSSLRWSRGDYARGGPVVFLEAFVGSFFFMYGMKTLPLAVASGLSSLAPVLAVPLSVRAGREKFSKLKTLAIVAVLIGVWLLTSF